MDHRLRILHISDLHSREDGQEWRRRRVLGDAWKANLDAFLEEGAVDVIAFTGDLAFSGRPGEYEGVTGFIFATLEWLKLGRERLFVVPGNHDVDRSVARHAWSELRQFSPSDTYILSTWMASDGQWAPKHCAPSLREEVLTRQQAYRTWVRETLGRPELLPSPALHPRLGYRQTLRLPGHPFDLHVIGFDSAWLSGDEHDTGRLWLTEEQLVRLSSGAGGEPLEGFRLALIHHPLGDLREHSRARYLLEPRVDLLLRGHLHEPAVELFEEADRRLRSLAAGCLHEHDRFPNSCQLIEVTLDERGQPQGHDVWFRSWSDRGRWRAEEGLYPGTRDGRRRWEGRPAAPATALHPGACDTLVGREQLLRDLGAALLAPSGSRRPVALQGMTGVGKTHLLDGLIHANKHHFPGGCIRLELELEEHRDARQLLLALADQLGTVAGSKPLEERLRDRLLAPLTLLCIDNVDAPAVAAAAAELVRLLPGCALVVTGSSQELGLGADWTRMKLRPLDEPSALEVLQASCPPESEVEWAGFHRLIRELGGLPLVLQLAAGQLRRGGTVNGLREDLRRWTLHAEGSSRALLRQFFASSLGLLRARLAAEEGGDARRLMEGLYALGLAPAAGVGRSLGAAMAGLSKEEFETLVSQASALSLLERDTCRVHPLLAELLREAVEQETVTDRMTEWFARRLEVLPPGRMDRQLTQWMREVREELCALASWLPRVPVRDLGRVGHVGADYARHEGPLHLWLAFYERAWAEGSEPEARSHALGILSSLALQAGSPDRALSAAHERRAMARSRGDEHAEALASAALADVLGSTGALDEALRIQREEVLPVFTRLGDTSWQARTWARIADLHGARGELDEALRLWRDEALPVFQRLGDLRGCAVTQARIAEVLASRSELEEAMRLLLEEILPCFKRLDDLHGHASTLEQIANVLLRQGRTWEARDVLIRASTYYTFLGDTHQADSVRKRQAELMSLIR